MTATATSSAATAQQGLSSASSARRPGTADRGLEFSIPRSSRPGLAGADEMSEEDRLWPGRVRRIGREQLCRWSLDSLCEPVELCLSELVTNAMRYGQGPVVDVRLYRTASHLCIEVADGSPDRPVLGVAGSDDESGRGLVLVDAVAESWGVTEDGTCTWCRLSVLEEQP
ncbi:ATP-binding protein [Streptomyces sp. NPDC102451]|uniref:ATP-binding protein n=1 Tax=Streptomyces sp. NPDC102451 TaxID=3366177 RepID=UPI00382661A7